MPTPQIADAQVACVVEIAGTNYQFWTSVELERIFVEPVSHCVLNVAEFTSATGGWETVKIGLGVPCKVYLAGQLALTGYVSSRQVLYGKETHSVQIRISSLTGNWPAATMDPKIDGDGGQFVNQTFLQMAQATGQKIDVSVVVAGSPPNADKIFDQVSVHEGETRLSFLQRLAPMRNLHAVDNPQGELVFARPDGTSGSGYQPSGYSLVEGQNILEARILMVNDLAVPQYEVIGQKPGTDQDNGTAASESSGIAYNTNYRGTPRPFVIAAEHTADNIDCQLRAQHEMQTTAMQMLDCVVVVQGWLTPDGKLWSSREVLGRTVSVMSPMLFPTGNTFAVLILKGAKHIQDSESGTRTELYLTVSQSLGTGAQSIGISGPGSNLP
jgi:prophage tail gpP-like protein